MHNSDQSLTTSELEQIDSLCEGFENELRSKGAAQPLGPLVKGLSDELRLVALRELILIQLEYEDEANRESVIAAHRAEFPEIIDWLDENAVDQLGSTVARSDELNEADYPTDFFSPDSGHDGRGGIRAGHMLKLSLPDYTLMETLGRGGMGTVFRARQESLDRVCAVKMISNLNLASDQELQRFSQEARLAAQLKHPGIVQIYDFGEADGTPYFSMELVDGPGLDRLVRERTATSQQAAEIMHSLAESVGYAHEHGVIHRDLKPSNVLIDKSGRPRISDFGLARALVRDAAMTAEGDVLGTPSYMPPEQASGDFDQVGVKSDVYSLGAILYELLTGRPPFRSETPLATIQQVMNEDVVHPAELNPTVDRDLETICLKCLDKTPDKRYASAGELADDLQRFIDGFPIQARRVNWLGRTSRWVRREPYVALACVGILVVLLAGTVVSSIFAFQASQQASIAEGEKEKANGLAEESLGKSQEIAKQLAANRLKTIEISKQSIEMAGQRGKWKEALATIDQALESISAAEKNGEVQSGSIDKVWFRLQKVTALNAVLRRNEAVKEIESLAKEPNLGKHQGLVTLWTADLQLIAGDRKQDPLEIIKLALEQGLPEADAAYARGLLAETTPQAIRQFEKSLEIRPYDQKLLGQACIFQILMGRHEDARKRAQTAQLLYPEDHTFPFLLAVSYGLNQQIPEAEAMLKGIEDDIGTVNKTFTLEALKAWNEFAEKMVRFDQLTTWERLSLVGTTLKLQGIIFLRAGSTESMAYQSPKSLRNIFTALLTWLRSQNALTSFASRKKATEDMHKAVMGHPEGFLLYFCGLAYTAVGELQTAKELFLQSADSPALFDRVRLDALDWALKCSAEQWFRKKTPPGLKEATDIARRRIDAGSIPPARIQLNSRIFTFAEEPVTGWLAAERTFAENPNARPAHLNALHMAVDAEFPKRALLLADTYLKKYPKDQAALQLKQRAEQMLPKVDAATSKKADEVKEERSQPEAEKVTVEKQEAETTKGGLKKKESPANSNDNKKES